MVKIKLDTPITDLRGKNLTVDVSSKEKGRKLCLRDYLLTILSSRFPVQNNKEIFWTTELGMLIADEKNKEIEISDDKQAFLKRIVENNKIKVNLPTGGEKEIELFLPYELSQVLQAIMTDEQKKELEK